jgi:sigma-B regulation protein RsbU (phosphoserine phosphatase)
MNRSDDTMTTFMNVDFGQQLRVIPPMSASDQPSGQGLSRKLFTTLPQSFPMRPPVTESMEVAARSVPMMGVSGDYCDFLPLHKGQVGLAIGDACGKGIGAAFLTASLRAAFRARVQTCWEAGELLASLNRTFCRHTSQWQFMTLAYGIWDTISHTFTYSGAGHPPMLHYQAATGRVSELKAGGMVIGICETAEYPVESIYLNLGDALVLYTDGITEAADVSDEMFGINRLKQVVAVHGKEPSETLTKNILAAASRFAHHGWEDDVTLVVVKRKG